MAISGIPESVNDFNLYLNGKKIIGQTGEVTLPNLEALNQTVSGAGVLGEYEAPVIGRFGSIEQEVVFRCMVKDMASLMSPGSNVDLTLRGAIQQVDPSTQKVSMVGMRIVFRGRCKSANFGTAKQGEAMNCSVTLELTYLLIELDKKSVVELDKLSSVYKLNGVDMLSGIRSLI